MPTGAEIGGRGWQAPARKIIYYVTKGYVFSMLQRLYFVQDGPIKKQFQSLGLISDPISTRQQKRPASCFEFPVVEML